MGLRSPDEAKRNPGLWQTGATSPDCAALHPGYALASWYAWGRRSALRIDAGAGHWVRL